MDFRLRLAASFTLAAAGAEQGLALAAAAALPPPDAPAAAGGGSDLLVAVAAALATSPLSGPQAPLRGGVPLSFNWDLSTQPLFLPPPPTSWAALLPEWWAGRAGPARPAAAAHSPAALAAAEAAQREAWSRALLRRSLPLHILRGALACDTAAPRPVSAQAGDAVLAAAAAAAQYGPEALRAASVRLRETAPPEGSGGGGAAWKAWCAVASLEQAAADTVAEVAAALAAPPGEAEAAAAAAASAAAAWGATLSSAGAACAAALQDTAQPTGVGLPLVGGCLAPLARLLQEALPFMLAVAAAWLPLVAPAKRQKASAGADAVARRAAEAVLATALRALLQAGGAAASTTLQPLAAALLPDAEEQAAALAAAAQGTGSGVTEASVRRVSTAVVDSQRRSLSLLQAQAERVVAALTAIIRTT